MSYEVEPFDKSLPADIQRELALLWAGTPEEDLAQETSTYDLHLITRLSGRLVGWAAVRFAPARMTVDLSVISGRGSIAHTAFLVNSLRALSDGETSIEWWTRGKSAFSARRVAQVNQLPEHRRIIRMERTGKAPKVEIKVRAFRADDDDAVVALNNAAFHSHPDRFDLTTEQLHEQLARKHASRADLLLAFIDKKLAGFIWTLPRAHQLGELHVLAVSPDLQGQGLGGQLLDAGTEHLMNARSAKVTYLYVDAQDQRAIEMYQRHGFVDAKRPLISYLA